jgi:two-component system, OmpR family, sensor kinase
MSRVPLRLRLTAAFGLAMAVLLTAAGFLLYDHLGASLDRTLAQGLRTRAADISALVNQADTGLQESGLRADGFAQVLDLRGKVVDQTPGLRRRLLTTAQLERARNGPQFVQRAKLDGKAVRLLAQPVSAQDRRLLVVVGAPLQSRDDALATLRAELLVGGPIGLLVASAIGYLLAAAALRPVDRMRARAAAISASRLSERLPVARSHDEVSRLGDTLNEMLARLETAMERERSFVADASHELRTPLAHVQAEVELALETPRTRAELEAALREVGIETDRLSQLAADLLLLARSDKGKLPLRLGVVAIDELFEGITARFDRRARDARREFEISAPHIQVRVDRLRVEQALGNLVENALRHGAGTIRISAEQRGDAVEFHVADDGTGFPPGFAPHAFERFSRAEQSRSSGGTGLGLAIVAAIASAHGGTADIVAAARGADIRLRIPNPARPRISEQQAPWPPRRRQTSGDPHPLRSSQAT